MMMMMMVVLVVVMMMVVVLLPSSAHFSRNALESFGRVQDRGAGEGTAQPTEQLELGGQWVNG